MAECDGALRGRATSTLAAGPGAWSFWLDLFFCLSWFIIFGLISLFLSEFCHIFGRGFWFVVFGPSTTTSPSYFSSSFSLEYHCLLCRKKKQFFEIFPLIFSILSSPPGSLFLFLHRPRTQASFAEGKSRICCDDEPQSLLKPGIWRSWLDHFVFGGLPTLRAGERGCWCFIALRLLHSYFSGAWVALSFKVCLLGLHKLCYPTIRDRSTWS